MTIKGASAKPIAPTNSYLCHESKLQHNYTAHSIKTENTNIKNS